MVFPFRRGRTVHRTEHGPAIRRELARALAELGKEFDKELAQLRADLCGECQIQGRRIDRISGHLWQGNRYSNDLAARVRGLEATHEQHAGLLRQIRRAVSDLEKAAKPSEDLPFNVVDLASASGGRRSEAA